MDKLAYPNYSEYMPVSTVFNLERWTTALRDIYVKIRLGLNKQAATDEITKDWPKAEKYNFSNWMKYYESGDVFKYKTAQNSYYVNDATNYFLPNPPTNKKVPSPIRSINEVKEDANHVADDFLQRQNKAQINNEFRRTLISRLNSIEKHLATSTAVDFFGKEYSSFIKSIQGLKHTLLTHEAGIGISAQTCLDLLIREARILERKNCQVGANVMIKLAQQTPGNQGDLAMGNVPAGGSIPQGLGNLDTPIPNLTAPPASENKNDKQNFSGIEGFLDNLEGVGITKGDELSVDDGDDNKIVDDENIIEIDASFSNDNELIVMSQDAVAQKRPVNHQNEKVRHESDHSDFDALVNSAFNNLTMEDLLKKLEYINLIFKTKEINRQLALADLMFSRLGLTPYFPNFSEVQQKNLDCLNYSATRMNDIISTLQGVLGKGKIDLTEDQGEVDPEAQLLQRHLENEEKKEKERKELRKEVNNQKLKENEDKPEIEVENVVEDLSTPNKNQTKPVLEKPIAPTPT